MMRADRSIYLEVLVRSAVKPNVLRKGILEHRQSSQAREQQMVGTLAGAMAEELCEAYSDSLEPSSVARAAMEAYAEMVEETPTLKLGGELPRDADLKHIRMAKH